MSGYLIITLFLGSLIICIFDFQKSSSTKRIILFSFFIILFIISASKNYDTCFDTQNYINSFEKNNGIIGIETIGFSWYEPGYSFIETITKSYTDNYFYLFATISLISLSLLAYIIYKYSPYPFLSLFIYISFFYFKRDIITIRYGCACMFCLLGIIKLIEKNNRLSYLFFFLGFLFHYSVMSVICYIPFLHYYMKHKTKNAELLCLICFLFSIIGITIFQFIMLAASFAPDFLSLGLNKGLAHLDDEGAGGLKQLIPYLPIIYFYNRVRIKDSFLKGLYLTLIFTIICMIELNQAASFARVNQIFLTSIILFLPNLLAKVKKSINFNYIYIYSLIISAYMFFRICFFNSGGFINTYW